MADKCAVCGSSSFTGSGPTRACSNCGATSADTTPVASPFAKGAGLGLPRRKNDSMNDRHKLEREKTFHNFGITGSVNLVSSWEGQLEKRPIDIPYYTAIGQTATIAVLLSRRSIGTEGVI